MKPFVYSVCDTGYRDLYAEAFVNSARAHGHDVEIFCTGKKAESLADKVRLCAWRFELLPQLLRTYGAVLMLDIDSVVQRPLNIADEYDLGIFLRPEQSKDRFKTLCSVFYCTDRAMDFAEEIITGGTHSVLWCDDQGVVWRAYEKLGHRYKVKRFDEGFISWRDASVPIFTGKGMAKTGRAFADALERWAAA